MSKPHDAQPTTLPFGNPFRRILPKGSYLSPKLLALLTSFEQTLAQSLNQLKPQNPSELVSLSWMTRAMAVLYDTHTNINTLTTVLQFPASDWDEKWTDAYLDSSVKLLDICNALTAEILELEQSQLLLKYAVHILASAGASPSSDELKRVHSSLHEWMEKRRSRTSKLENCIVILKELAATLHLVKVKNSAKGKVLMRALYGVKAVTVLVCSIFTAALSGCSKLALDLTVPGDFLWANAFNDLKASAEGEIASQPLKELEAVNACVEKLHKASICINQMKEETPSSETNPGEWKKLSTDMTGSVECVTREIDLLSKQLDGFFHLVLAGRDALLLSLTSSSVQVKVKGDRFW